MIQEVNDFLKQCKTYYLATVEGDQPRVRPFGTVNLYEGKLYIQTGKTKNVSKQIAVNPKIEITAYDGGANWIRIQAVAVEDPRLEPKKSMLAAYPELQSMYKAEGPNTEVFYLKDALAIIYTYTGEIREIKL
ncbi:pyridoxamine 5'-phosphate oxidase [Bacteroidia bacterium]|nr:pyridoxamine 5'-phosphate oxidase [Bacteroidia bacterium]GHU55811.1 pyridoxamine 5'-phosphate oxidase [Bacteroidia bacterium]GHV04466.1 pyridoxamine 5'-phosphate oxidase [Bacteroidia bacterium]